MLRVTLNPEMRVSTAQPKMTLGELPTALGIEFKKEGRKATQPIDPEPIKKKAFSSAIETTEETRELIVRSVKDEYARMHAEGEITDEGISQIAYKPHAGGRPTDYTKKHPTIVFHFALLGLSDERIAAAMGIDVTTFIAWRDSKPEFSQALVDGRENVDGLVINAVFKRATGFKYQSVKIFHNKDDGTVYAPYEEYVPPDINAAKYFLSIRRGKLRKDGWDDTGDANAIRSAVQVNINVADPQEAAKQYREIMQLEGIAE